MKYYFTACTRFNNKQVDGIVEFIDYYTIVGAEHFFLVNTDPDETLSKKILKPYIDKNLVTLLHMPIYETLYSDSQWINCYYIATNSAKGKCRWMAYIDIDEFILPMTKDTIPEILKDYDGHSVLVVNWVIFGSSNLIKSPQSQLKELFHRSEFDTLNNTHIKSIADPNKFCGMITPHYVVTTDNRSVNSNFEPVHGPFSPIHMDKIRINHYIIKSREEFKKDTEALPYKNEEFFIYHDRNEIFDDEIWRRFGDKVKVFHESIHGNSLMYK